MEFVNSITGFGSETADLESENIRRILSEALAPISEGERVLAIIPDKTRDDNTPQLFPLVAEILGERAVEKFDALVAQGTHAPMTTAEKRAKVGFSEENANHFHGQIFDHKWNVPEELTTIGELSAVQISRLTSGLLNEAIPLTVNRLLAPGIYDTILIFGATVPHEVAGYAGGAKYFFPGVSGAELTHATHWLGALSGIEAVIGRVETPTRHLIEAAAERIPARVISLNSVVSRTAENRLRTHALFCGDVKIAFRRAAAVSSQIHVKYMRRKYKRVVALLDEHYDEMWTGGKASYRLGAIVEEGGELIIYAPHLRCFSGTHGALIERYGYAPLERVRRMVAESSELKNNLCVAAHLAHVAYAARRDAPTESRYKITLASQISEADCRRVGFDFIDYKTFSSVDYENDDDALIVENAGRDLYLVD